MSAFKYFPHTDFEALARGFVEVPEEVPNVDRPLFVKDGKKWIYTIKGLKKDLGVRTNDELVSLGYDVETYLLVEKEHQEKNQHLKNLHSELQVSSDSSEPVYLEGGMYLYSDGSIR